jgi:dihydroorotase
MLSQNTCVLNAEIKFLPNLVKLHARFPRLRIVLEHATTRAAVETVKSLGDTIGCTITAHHLDLTVDDWAGQGWHYCKPVAKYPDDRDALREVVREGGFETCRATQTGLIEPVSVTGHPRFFLGSDSAPHPRHAKSTTTPMHGCAAGIYTSPILLPLVAKILESFGALDKIENFVSTFGRAFYRKEVRPGENGVTLRRIKGDGKLIPECLEGELVPFGAGRKLAWEITEGEEAV